MMRTEPLVLAINAGSSSVKFATYRLSDPPERQLRGSIDRIGTREANFVADDSSASGRQSRDLGAVDSEQAADYLVDWLDHRIGLASIDACGHRVATGGANYIDPQYITDELLDDLRRISGSAPEHLPFEIALIDRFRQRVPDRPHVVCFDTTFHRDMPAVARILPIPRGLYEKGVARYGFHGVSYAYLMETLAREAGRDAAQGRVILAHLGNGASLAAVHCGKSMDTTMALTPASGVPMSRRSGDLDPGLVGYLANTEGMTAETFNDMVNRQSGLFGVSETSGDVRDLLAREGDDPRAAEALGLFCYEVKKRIGAYAAALGGVETLIFAGGIGENASAIRARICERLDFLGLELDHARNAAGEPVISSEASRVKVRVMRTNEEIMIAKTTARVIGLA